ncbi:amidase family protein, partial [Acinetobacter baumannii]|uniref:amidase family protein n=1 Tax=Acinetobacter baumannii TaxID=470 RepID=UPI001BC8958F
GLKPTYGRVSRFGIIAYASSLDQAGPMARSAEDCAYLMNVLAELMQIKPQDKDRFFKVSKANFGEIYSTNNQNTLQVLASLQNVMAKDEVLKAYV